VAKPRSGGSSVATSIVGEPAEFEAALRQVFATGDDALVEGRIRGVELSCGVLGNRGAQLRALQPIEIRPRAGKFFDYEQKYSSDGALELCPPLGLEPAMIERVRVAAVAIHGAAGCDGYSRTDFIVPQAELSSEDEPVLLEVNTLPGLTARSLLPQEAAVDGLDYRSLCLLLLELAFQRRA
jgi:D-alanine-D-alanine ligase